MDDYSCIGTCPTNAYCDYGICRCRSGFDSRYGLCWETLDDFNWNHPMWTHREKPGFDPHIECTEHEFCQVSDMNLICDFESKSCQCREDMKWNSEALECQIFIVSHSLNW